MLTDLSGIYAAPTGPGSVFAARQAAADFVAAHAAHKGRKIEVVAGDHQNKPDVGASIANRWTDNEKVDVIVDVPTSSVAFVVNDIVKNKNKVFLASGAAASDLTGARCTPNTVHWTYDTWALANGTGKAIATTGGDSWFFITADYAFGHALERDTAAVVEANKGKVVGRVRHPLATNDFSSFLLQAQASKAKIVALANAGGDTINAIKQAAEFGIVPRRPEARRHAGQHQRHRCARSQDRAGTDAHRALVLGRERGQPCIREDLRRRPWRPASDHDPCRRLRRGDALPQGGRSRSGAPATARPWLRR